MKHLNKGLWSLAIAMGTPLQALAAETNAPLKADSGDTAFILICAALVLLMTPGVAFFYGGMVRHKNVLSTLMQVFVIMGIVSVQWVLFGYSVSFGPDISHIIGDLSWAGLNGIGLEPFKDYSETIPHLAFIAFQMMFAIITVALVTGSIVERMRFPAFVLFVLLWTSVIYDPLAHMVWGVGGWLRDLGALDFAGGLVVHISSGVSGLVAAMVIGRRKGYKKVPFVPHHLPMVSLGGTLLWFGWFGFNAGSALGANGLAANAFVVTNTACGAATLAWVLAEWLHSGKPTLLGAISGLVAGLVAITPAAGYVSALHAILIGLAAGVICYFAVLLIKEKTGIDDSLDAFGIHGVGGTWGAIATGIFASKAINPAGADGLLYGSVEPLVNQFIAIAFTYVLSIVGTFVILKLIALVTPLRATHTEEIAGLDETMHGQSAYALSGTGAKLVGTALGSDTSAQIELSQGQVNLREVSAQDPI